MWNQRIVTIAAALGMASALGCGDKTPAASPEPPPATAPSTPAAPPPPPHTVAPPTPAPAPVAVVIGDANRQKSIAGLSVGTWLDALEELSQGDLGAALNIYTADTRWHAMDATGQIIEGKAALRGVWSGLKAGFSDLRAHPTRFILFEDGRILLESIGLGTHDGDLGEHSASGRDFAVEQAQLSQVEDGLITETWVYSDAAALLSQLGFVHGSTPMATVDPAAPVVVVGGAANPAHEQGARRLYARLAKDAGETEGATQIDLAKVAATDHALGIRTTAALAALATLAPGTRLSVDELHSAGDTVVASLSYSGATDPKGAALKLTALHVLTYGPDGNLAQIDLYYDTIAVRLAKGTWPPEDPTGP